MPQGPSLVFDKSSLESLNLDEAVLLDNFYMSTITPLFFVECLADLEKKISSNSTPEQLVGSLADRTPDAQSSPNVHHTRLLAGELRRNFNLKTVHHRPAVDFGEPVQLGDQKGIIFRRSKEAEALSRWTGRHFLEVERNVAKEWRRSLTHINFAAMVAHVKHHLGPWRTPKTLQDARQLADIMIDNLDPEYVLRFGIDLLGLPEATDWVLKDWIGQRRPALREYVPYFVLMLTINIFFCLIQPTQLLSKVKESHAVDLAYLYYLPFCSVFTSKDNFHAQIVPLFLEPDQSFVNGSELKEDLRRLNALYSALPPAVLRTGLINFANTPPEDTTYLTTRLWDKHLPDWRALKENKVPRSPEDEQKLVARINQLAESPPIQSHNEYDIDKLEYALVEHRLYPKKGKWLRFSEDQIQRALEHERKKAEGTTDKPSSPQSEMEVK
jgi:hypothetical protein